jgi:hypothetical protein
MSFDLKRRRLLSFFETIVGVQTTLSPPFFRARTPFFLTTGTAALAWDQFLRDASFDSRSRRGGVLVWNAAQESTTRAG